MKVSVPLVLSVCCLYPNPPGPGDERRDIKTNAKYKQVIIMSNIRRRVKESGDELELDVIERCW